MKRRTKEAFRISWQKIAQSGRPLEDHLAGTGILVNPERYHRVDVDGDVIFYDLWSRS